jgi:5S rRNA maturation endonuclease (ribonuclease M5)
MAHHGRRNTGGRGGTTAERLARALLGRQVGAGWMARCPAHDDRNPSLAIREKDGKVLVHCHAGCNQRDVIEALRSMGVWESEQRQPGRRIVASYDYVDEDGKVLYQVVRYEPKTFRQRRPDGYGGWSWKKGEHLILYRLPEVLEAPIVFVVEGEKDVETLRAHGFVATTNAGGAKAPWLPQYTEALRGREVILIPDNDEPGRARVLRIARALLGVAAKIVIVELEGAKDVSDWFGAGHDELELIREVEGEEVSQ